MPTSIETKETTVSDSPTVRGCWRGKEDPQRLVSKDSQGSSEHPKVQSPDIKYRAPWPLSSSPDAKCSMQPSPTTGWPQRSPIKPEHDQDVASFALFTQSFDTLSETGQHFMRPSPEHPPRKIELAATNDISPIKLEDPKSSHRYSPANRPDTHKDTSTYNASGYSTTASNPFYVLRSVAKAFDRCSYKLPCLYDGEICPVNLSTYGTVHRYQESVIMGEKDLELARRRVDSAVHAFGGDTQRSQSIFRTRSSAKEFYDSCFHRRYFVAGNHISWELESHPPVALNVENGQQFQAPHGVEEGGGIRFSSSAIQMDSNHQKMRYRCKLCGQLKQNHNCPYQQSLQRSIAIMVYPAVNAYTASEPGVLTKPLSEMNNFVSYDDASEHHMSPLGRITHITPETKPRLLYHSPESSLSTHSYPSPRRGRKRSPPDVATPPSACRRPYFVSKTLALRPEHYRAVTTRQQDEYQYPHVPLSFQERKRLSDTLFFLSKEIPTMTAHIAPLLRLARENDDWDLAVAQILTQVVVALYCAEGDTSLEGLQRYLLTIGISC